MRQFNWLLTLLTTAVLVVTLAILFWLRGRTAQALDDAIEQSRGLFDAGGVLGSPEERDVDFGLAEGYCESAKRSA